MAQPFTDSRADPMSYVGASLMTIATSRPVGAYITEREMPITADGRVFELLLPYEVEGSK